MTILGTTTAGYYRHTVELHTWRDIAAELALPVLDRAHTTLETIAERMRGVRRRETFVRWSRLAA